MQQLKQKNYTKIKGWGIDADPDNDPAYPMRDDETPNVVESTARPTQQQASVEILKSIERPTISAVFGTSTPPVGLSGLIRRKAFKYSESNGARWMLLLFADRVNMIEGIFQDLMKGHVPNIFSEMGLKSELKYNRKKWTKNAMAISTLGLSAYILHRKIKAR